jgi:hypothetical protein
MASMPTVTMTPMHEDVHERAGEDEEVGEVTKSVREVLGPQEKTDDHQQDRAHEKRARRPETALPQVALMVLRVFVNWHSALHVIHGI